MSQPQPRSAEEAQKIRCACTFQQPHAPLTHLGLVRPRTPSKSLPRRRGWCTSLCTTVHIVPHCTTVHNDREDEDQEEESRPEDEGRLTVGVVQDLRPLGPRKRNGFCTSEGRMEKILIEGQAEIQNNLHSRPSGAGTGKNFCIVTGRL